MFEVETPEFKKQRWDNLTDAKREKFEREMRDWAYFYPFTNKVVNGNVKNLTDKEILDLIKLGEDRRNERTP